MKYLTTAFAITLLLSSMFIMGCGDDDDDDDGGASNFLPVIDKIQAYGTVIKQGVSMPFKASATDWDGETVEYTWEATVGQLDKTTGEEVIWTAPDTPGNAEVTLSVTDGRSDPVIGTVSITVEADKGLEGDIIGTWSLVSIDNEPLFNYQDQITLIKAADEDAGEPESEFEVHVGYSSREYTYNQDETHTEHLEFEYRIPGPSASGLPISNIACESDITGEYSVSGSDLTIELILEEITVEADYNASKYNADQTIVLDGYLEDLQEAMRTLIDSIEPGEVGVENAQMEWSNNWSWEKALVTVEFQKG